MKISNSQKQLAKIISENGGWREGAKFAAQDQDGDVFFYAAKPTRSGGWWLHDGGLCDVCIVRDEALPNWHQTILSRDEYFHRYPAPDADGWIEWRGGECPVAPDTMVVCRLVEGHEWKGGCPVKAGSMCWDLKGILDIIAYRLHKPEQSIEQMCSGVTEQNKHAHVDAHPTIEQLAAEYRNRQDYAERKQQEADAAKAEAEAKLAELVAAGKAVGLVLSVAASDPELVIADWRDLQEGDEVEVLWAANPNWVRFTGKVISVVSVGVASALCSHGGDFWNIHEGTKWRFIRRPSKEATNA